MKRASLVPYFLASVLLLAGLFSLYVFYESRWLEEELVRQVKVKALALTRTMETSAKKSIKGNALIEELVRQRLLDNARLIDRLLTANAPAPLVQRISTINQLHKVELLDLQGRPWVSHTGTAPPDVEGLLAELRERWSSQESTVHIWGRLWSQPRGQAPTLPQHEFWEDSVFGVALEARSFPGFIAIHADAAYMLKLQREIGVQRQIQDLGRQEGIHHLALLDNDFTVLAHTDAALAGNRMVDDLSARARVTDRSAHRIVDTEEGGRRYELVKPVRLDGDPMGFLRIGVSMDVVDAAWWKSLWSMVGLGCGILGLGVLGFAAILYNQRFHMQEIKALEAEVDRREHLSMMGNLAATVAHEVRNPLNAISMGLQRLKGEFQPTQDEGEYSRFIELMRAEVHRLNAIVEEFLTLARPLNIKPDLVKVDQLLKDLTTLTGGDAESSGVEIAVVHHGPRPVVKADPDYLKQVLLNLILNGLQAMPEGGKLTIETSIRDGKMRLSVSDTGVGIAKENQARIFEPYFTTKSEGSGLGLPIARRIVESHGGTIEVTSQTDAGTRFDIVLPLDHTLT
ncbi:MAG: ATP-binding protein [Deltaproteobacteria bacterium]|nr:ATP-binding protein [Deltaproteobacteria bacterium]